MALNSDSYSRHPDSLRVVALCACGRKALILARCLQCARDGLLAEEAARQEAVDPGLAAGALPAHVAALAALRNGTRESLLVGCRTQRLTPAFLSMALARQKGHNILDENPVLWRWRDKKGANSSMETLCSMAAARQKEASP